MPKSKVQKEIVATEKPEKPSGIKTMEIPNFSLSLLYMLLNIPMHGAQSRARNRFALIVRNAITRLEDSRVEILERYAKKDDEGKPKKVGEGEDEEYDVPPRDLVKYRTEFDKLMKEKLVIDLLPSIKPDIVAMRPLVLESKFPIETADGYTYEEICKAFEAV